MQVFCGKWRLGMGKSAVADRPVRRVSDIDRLTRPAASPFLDEGARGIVFAGLLFQIEMAAAPGVRAQAGDVLPVAIVAGYVIVDEVFLEEGSAIAPVELELVDQAAGGDLPATVAGQPVATSWRITALTSG